MKDDLGKPTKGLELQPIIRRNVHEVLQDACWALNVSGIREKSRNGPVRTLPYPITVCYQRPRERVLLWPARKANPFFHLFESLWMLAGREDLAYVEQFVPRMREFSDDGIVLNGAYGKRWHTQLPAIIDMLHTDPTTRRAVIILWDQKDLWSTSKDIPCNTQIYFRVMDGFLNMTVTNRSNDLVWGMCGSNVVHFSILHEFVAHATGNVLGQYFHITNNLHIYDNVPKRAIYSAPSIWDPYSKSALQGGVESRPMFTVGWRLWLDDCRRFVDSTAPEQLTYSDPWFAGVAIPMWNAWKSQSPLPLEQCIAEDWRKAGRIYLEVTNEVSSVV